ncbi:MAG: hypothetical protein IOB84_13710 [Brevundimonas sp.]|nr:hypothetical protein [Brevundimonas sp.]
MRRGLLRVPLPIITRLKGVQGLDLDFANGRYALNSPYGSAFPAGWSFSRTGAATALDLAGNVIQFATGVPRITNRGLLVEEGRTNLFLNSALAGGGSAPTSWFWDIGTGTSAPVSSVYLSGGTAYQQTATAQRPFIRQQPAVAANTTYTASFLVEANPNGIDAQNMILAVGLPAGASQSYPQGGTFVPVAGQRVLLQIVVAATAGTAQVRCGVGVQANATGSLTFSLPQFETGTAATSPIITTGAAGTRGVDTAGVNPLFGAISGEYTVVAEVDITRAPGVQQNVFLLWDGTNVNRAYVLRQTGGAFELAVVSSNVYRGGRVSSVVSSTGIVKVGVSCTAAGLFRMALNGTALVTAGPFAAPIVDRLAIGQTSTAGDRPNDSIARIRIIPRAVSDAELQALTA